MSEKGISQYTKNFAEAYSKKEFAKARQLLLDNRDKFSDSLFYYNYGTLYVKEGNYPVARFHLQKSLKSGGFRQEVIQNLQYTKSKLNLSDLNPAVTAFVDIPTGLYLSLTIIFFIFTTIFYKLKFLKTKRVIIGFVLISMLPWLLGQILSSNIRGAILLENGIVREGPSKIFDQTSEIIAGEKIIVGEVSGSHCKILYPLKFAGWIEKKRIGIY